ncbi:MAG: sugar transferase [Oscillospiraceae bacterium]|nr:sugar transferase [Oscillospiraceae bacterium]
MADIKTINMTTIMEDTAIKAVIHDTINHEYSLTENESVVSVTQQSLRNIAYIKLFLKRMTDILLSLTAIIILLFPAAVIACIIHAEDRGPVFYKSSRVGRNGRTFWIYKFRTMKQNADKLENYLTEEELEEYHKVYKIKHDPRITKCGNWLRRTSLDELPQFFNVLTGDMSLVGPRPVTQEETELYGPSRDQFLSVRPGITGYWQAYARNGATYEGGERQAMELFYIQNHSALLDIKILMRTVYAVLTQHEAS